MLKNDKTKRSLFSSQNSTSITHRLTFLYTFTAFGILLVTISFLYYALMKGLEEEDRQFLIATTQRVRLILKEHPDNLGVLQQEIEGGGEFQYIHYYVRILDAKGTVLAKTSDKTFNLPPDIFPQPVDYNTLPEKGKRKRFSGDMVYLLMAAWAAEDTPGGRTWLIQTALDVSREAEIIRRYRIKVEIALAAGVFISVIAGVLIARRGLRPLNEITKVIQLVRATQLHERINPSQWPKELTVLATSFDEMLSRLQDSFNRLSQFSSDLAHELRTPINNLMGEAEVALAKPRSPEEYQQVLGSSLEELRHLLHMIESLLFLARAESTDIRIESTVFDPVKEIETVLDYYDALIEEKQLRITSQGSVSLRADPLLFRRVINNVLSNAIKYTPAGGAVGITAVKTESGVTIIVDDSGVGIAADELENIFSRFYRGRATRSLDAKGTGLGLAIVKSIMDLHGGSINIQSEPSKGTIITLSFPQVS